MEQRIYQFDGHFIGEFLATGLDGKLLLGLRDFRLSGVSVLGNEEQAKRERW